MIDKQEPSILNSDKQEGAKGKIRETGVQESKSITSVELGKSPEIPPTDTNEARGTLVSSEKLNVAIPAQQPVNSTPLVQEYSQQEYLAIERVLEEDLSPIYAKMSPQQQQQFRLKGEEVTRTILKMVYRETKVRVKKIISLIRGWLKLIPGINKYFLEQEAKIKADRIAEIAIREGKKVEF